ncbi:spore coat U domain-containing protein [Pseudomonas sp. NPDC086251]|uniref:Csu type fimbrial protein n=1 Tax=Pseudomonas sp. NPDC086251 TaxID=3364431 RepID=UPI003836155E
MLVLLWVAADAHAVSNGQIYARLTLFDGCVVTSGRPSAFGELQGEGPRLDFGDRGPTWTSALKASVNATVMGRLAVACSSSVADIRVAIDAGLHGDGSTRRLSNGRQTLPYQLFLDPANTESYRINQPHPYSLLGRSSLLIPIYGWLTSNSHALASGIYSDTLTVTLDW